MTRWLRSTLVCLALLLLAGLWQKPAFASGSDRLSCQEPNSSSDGTITLSDQVKGELRTLVASYLMDETGSVLADTIAEQAFTETLCRGPFPMPSSAGALWLRFQLSYADRGQKTWYLSTTEIFVHELALYEKSADGMSLISRNGRSVSIEERPVGSSRIAVPVSIDAGDVRTLYLRISGTFAPLVTPVIATENLFLDWSANSNAIGLFILSFAGMMALFSLILFRSIDPQSYRYYTLYMVSRFAFTFFYHDWFASLTGIIVPPEVSANVAQALGGASTLIIILFCRALLLRDEDSRWHENAYRLLFAFGVLVIGATMVSQQTVHIPLFMFNVLTPLVLLVLSVLAYKNGLRYAKWVSAGLAVLMTGLLTGVLGFLFPENFVSVSSAGELLLQTPLKFGYLVAVFCEPIFMMVAISAMVQTMRVQKEAAIAETIELRDDIAEAANRTQSRQRITEARIEALETIVRDDGHANLLPPVEKRFVEKVTNTVLENAAIDGFGARELADRLSTSERTLGRRLKHATGMTPAAFIRAVRLNLAHDLIMFQQHKTVAEVAYASGFSSVSHFAKLYRAQFSEKPSETIKALKPSGQA